MNDTLFKSMLESKKATKKWMFFPMSVVLHGAAFAVLLVGPYISASDSFPQAKVFNVTLVSAPAIPTVPAGRPASGGHKRAPKKEAESAKPVLKTPANVLIAPVIIPEDIVEEDLTSGFGLGEGSGLVDGSLDEGPDLGGIIGGPGFGKGGPMGEGETLRLPSVSKPKLIRRVEPNYPVVALRAHIQGTVLLEAATDISGYVVRVNVINGHPLLSPAAVEAVKKWVYEPYMIGGLPKPVIFTVTVQFRLD